MPPCTRPTTHLRTRALPAPWLLIVALACAEPDAFGPEPPERAAPVPAIPVATATTNVWASKAAMPTPRHALAVGVVNGIVYAVGGTRNGINQATVEAYNPGSDSWTARAPPPQSRSGLNGSGTINGVLYVAGGFGTNGATNTLYAYNPSTNTWATRAPMIYSAVCGGSGVIGGRLYVYGYTGCTVGGVSFQRYDPATNKWTALTVTTWPHSGPTVGVAGGKFYLAGGATNGAFYVVAGLSNGTLNQAYLP